MKEISLQNDFYSKAGDFSTGQTNPEKWASTVLQRVATGDQTAVRNCLANYGAVIWSMAKKFTGTNEDTEAVTEEIFRNIWRYAARFEQTDFDELLFVTIIARRQIKNYLEKSGRSIN